LSALAFFAADKAPKHLDDVDVFSELPEDSQQAFIDCGCSERRRRSEKRSGHKDKTFEAARREKLLVAWSRHDAGSTSGDTRQRDEK